MRPFAKFHRDIFMESKVMITEIKNPFKIYITMLWCPPDLPTGF